MKRQPKYRYFEAIHRGAKVPRKYKKHFLGDRISNNALKRLMKRVKLVLYRDEHRPSYPIVIIDPYPFCPKCGCTQHRSVIRPSYWPEVYNSYYCLRCGHLVAWEDNSPYTHVLEEYLYEDYERQIQDRDNLPVYVYPEY